MTAELTEQERLEGVRERSSLVATLDTPIPYALPPGRSTAVFLLGTCYDREREIHRLGITVDGVYHQVRSFRMPRPDSFEREPTDHSYRSGFWATVPVPGRPLPGRIEIQLVAEFAGERSEHVSLTGIEVREPEPTPEFADRAERHGDGELIAICMATYNPDIQLFKVQVESIRNQTDTDWVCLLSDDCSDPDSFSRLTEVIAGDGRFTVSRSEERLGFYRNFERALTLVPDDAELVALSDQDDHWYPEKLATLRGSLGDSQLVYSDLRMVDRDGLVLADSLWNGRRNNCTNFASLLISNTIAGAASMFRRSMLETALPFPEGPGWQFHDHWLGSVALATGRLAYVDKPLYDYIQHSNAITGQVTVNPDEDTGSTGKAVRRSRLPALKLPRGFFAAWHVAYFRAYLQLQLQAEVLLARCRPSLTGRRSRALRLLSRADTSVSGSLWLLARTVRPLFGRNETLGTEQLLLRGLLWRRLIGPRSRGKGPSDGNLLSASLPPFDIEQLGTSRIKRWRANL